MKKDCVEHTQQCWALRSLAWERRFVSYTSLGRGREEAWSVQFANFKVGFKNKNLGKHLHNCTKYSQSAPLERNKQIQLMTVNELIEKYVTVNVTNDIWQDHYCAGSVRLFVFEARVCMCHAYHLLACKLHVFKWSLCKTIIVFKCARAICIP